MFKRWTVKFKGHEGYINGYVYYTAQAAKEAATRWKGVPKGVSIKTAEKMEAGYVRR